MDTARKREKISSIERRGDELKIVVTHITIRQSIFFLLMKLILLELFAALVFIISQSLYFSPSFTPLISTLQPFSTLFFFVLVCIKTLVMMSIIFSWLEEYYEITPTEIIHKKGIIFKKEQRYRLKHVGSFTLEQGFWGRIFNFGTIRLYDWLISKDAHLYLIHNPRKYHHILEDLLPEGDVEKEVFREHFVEKEDI